MTAPPEPSRITALRVVRLTEYRGASKAYLISFMLRRPRRRHGALLMPALRANLRELGPALPILIGASVMLSLSMGLRQSLGLFMQPLTQDIHISVSDFTLAIAIQNLAWGFLQPVAGALTPRFGFRPIMVAGALMYVVGLVALAAANGLIAVMIGAGILIGASLACTASALAMSVSARAVRAAAAQPGLWHRLGRRIDRRHDCRADRPGACERLSAGASASSALSRSPSS